MREKISFILKKIYGVTMTVAFFGGVLPLIPFIIAMIIGGPTGEAISLFLYQKYYVVIIALASISIVFGLIGMYVDKVEALSSKSLKNNGEKK